MLSLILHTVVVLVLILWETKNLELRYRSLAEFIEEYPDSEEGPTIVIMVGVTLLRVTLILLAAYLI